MESAGSAAARSGGPELRPPTARVRRYASVDDDAEADALLYAAYASAMREAKAKQLPDVAFSLLSAGARPATRRGGAARWSSRGICS